MAETWHNIFGSVWNHTDIHFTPTVWAIGMLYDNRRVTTTTFGGRGVQILIGPIVIRVYFSHKPKWCKWREKNTNHGSESARQGGGPADSKT